MLWYRQWCLRPGGRVMVDDLCEMHTGGVAWDRL